MEQNIYTYCFQRFNKTGGGFGIYSQSDGIIQCFENEEKMESVCKSYLVPLNSSVWLSDGDIDIKLEEERIRKYHPEKFGYQILTRDEKNMAALIYGKNLGRATVGARPGNIVVYTLLGSSAEIADYPCFYADDPDFVNFSRDYFMRDPDDPQKYLDPSGMDAKRAKKLMPKSISAGNSVTRESIHRFLCDEQGSDEVLTELFYALISERSGKKRPIVICDSKEKIKYWIAALTLLFPLPTAKNITFSTYEFMGTRAVMSIPEEYSIFGVYSPTANDSPEEKATNYSYDEMKNNADIVLFDLERGVLPEYKKDDFAEIIKRFCRGDESLLRNFHDYILSQTTYNDFDQLYTLFYPVDSVKCELFSYYNKETKENILNEYYPCLFEPYAEDNDLEKTVRIIFEADKFGILDKECLEEDIREYIRRIIGDDTLEDLSPILRMQKIVKIVGLDSNKVMKDQITKYAKALSSQNVSKCLSANKIGAMLELFDINDIYLESDTVSYLVTILKKSDEGRKKMSDIVYCWLQNGFKNGKTNLTPDSVLALIKLDICNKDRNIDYVIRESMLSENIYQRGLLELLLRSEFLGIVLNKLEVYLWKGDCSYIRVYNYVQMVRSINPDTAKSLEQSFKDHIHSEPITVQKNIVEQFLETPTVRLDGFWDSLIEKIYKSYPFNSEDDIALFSYKFYKKALQQNVFNYKESLLLSLLKRINCNEKKWKKAIDRLPAPEDDRQDDNNIIEIMKGVFKSKPEEFVNEDSDSDKKGKFGSFFDGLINKFKK